MAQRPYIAIIDYGLGNVGSVRNAFEFLKVETVVTRRLDELQASAGMVLPGVGAFGDGMARLSNYGLKDGLDELVLQEGKPILGICLGMQLMASTGLEHGRHAGLGWIEGTVERLNAEREGLKIPHVGWNELQILKKDELLDDNELLRCFYFVHGYHFALDDDDYRLAVCNYGVNFTAAIRKGNIFGTQFHPEKSQKAGLGLLAKYANFCLQKIEIHA